MTRIALVLLIALLWVVPAQAQISAVQTASGSGNDVAVTFGSAWGASNHIVAVVMNNADTETVSITGVSTSVTTLFANTDVGSFNGAAFCWPGDGSDTSFTATTSGGSTVRVAAIEISGGSCTVDGTPTFDSDSTTPYNLTPLYTTTAAGSIIVGLIHSTSASNYSADTGTTSIPADGTDINGIALGGYRIAGAAGDYDLPWTSAANETSTIVIAAVRQAVSGATPARQMLLGVGTPR